MVDKIDIPIEVSGSKEAQAEIKQTSEAVEQAGKRSAETSRTVASATDESGKRQEQANEQLKRGGDLFGEVDRKSERMAKTLLAQANPQLAQMVDLFQTINEGALGVSRTLLAFTGVTIGIAAATALLRELARASQEAAEATRRLEEAERSRREAANQERAEIGRRAVGLGVLTPADELRRRRAQIERTGIPEDIAESAVLAEQLAGLTPEQTEQLLAGMAASGATPIQFGQTRGESLAAIQRALAAGQRPEAGQALLALRAATTPTTVADAIDQALASVRERNLGLSDDDAATIRRAVTAELASQYREQARVSVIASETAGFLGLVDQSEVERLFPLAGQVSAEALRRLQATQALAGSAERLPRVITVNNIGVINQSRGLLDSAPPPAEFEGEAR